MYKNYILTLFASASIFSAANAQIGSSINITVNPLSITNTSSSQSELQDASTTILYVTPASTCEAIAKVTSTADLGTVTSEVTIDASAGTYITDPFVRRYYDIHPTMNENSTSEITLYFSQADIDDYNAHSLVTSGAFPPIASDLSNLLITAFHGSKSDGTTGPNGVYDSTGKTVIVPTSSVFDATYNFWAVTFTSNGFSGLFAHTNVWSAPLDIKLNDIYALNNGSENELHWSTLSENEGDYFEVEKSASTNDFEKVGTVPAKGSAPSKYIWTDVQPYEGATYYRLKLVNKDLTNTYTQIVYAVMDKEFKLTAFPNPFQNTLNVELAGKIEKNASLKIMNQEGKEMQQLNIEKSGVYQFHTTDMAQGVYYLEFINGAQKEVIKISKN